MASPFLANLEVVQQVVAIGENRMDEIRRLVFQFVLVVWKIPLLPTDNFSSDGVGLLSHIGNHRTADAFQRYIIS